ncbi:MAG: NERD domain-containing protein kinase family protein [Bradymonadaceae bacterium]
MARYIPIGTPANDAEKEGIRLLRDTLPDHFVVIGNFDMRLPQRRNSLEYDAVVIGEHGLYAVEIKGWRGPIVGDARRWKLNWGRVQNPFIHLEKKAKALREFIMQSVDGLPQSIYCAPVVLLPHGGVELDIDDGWQKQLLRPEELWNYFVDEERIVSRGPGPLLDKELREKVVDAIVPRAKPSERLVGIQHYDVEGELEIEDKPYREFVGSHRFLRHRHRVRIKAYVADLLAPADNRSGHFNRILRDMEALGSLEDNPYIARPYETVQDREDELIFYLISEWVGPRTLGDYMARENAMEWRSDREKMGRRWSFARHLVQAVSFMHSRDIIHRNLNPGVIYLTESPQTVPLKIADFDYARVGDLQSIAQELTCIGTQGYRAPELWLDQDYDHRVDIFSVGVIIYELLAGRSLYGNISDILQHSEIWKERRRLLPDDRVRTVLDAMVDGDFHARVDHLEDALALFCEDPPET